MTVLRLPNWLRSATPLDLAVVCNFRIPAGATDSAPREISISGVESLVGYLSAPDNACAISGFEGADIYGLDEAIAVLGGSDDTKIIFLIADERDALTTFAEKDALTTGRTRRKSREFAPAPSSIWKERSDTFSRHEKNAWGVAALTDSMLVAAKEAGANKHIIPARQDEIAKSAGIDSRLPELITSLLAAAGLGRDPVGWPSSWSHDMCAQFECLGYDSQLRAGFYTEGQKRYKPASYGKFWQEHDGGIEWYEWMYNGRKRMHDDCIATIRDIDAQEGREVPVMDIGCGMGVGYADALAGRQFVGVDLAKSTIEWCIENRAAPDHTYLCLETLAPGAVAQLAEFGSEFVFSQGTIDNTWDMYEYLSAMRAITRKWIYLTAYRGWFSDLPTHRHMWQPDTTAYYNDISPELLERQLRELGFSEIAISPIETGNEPPQPAHETRILARL